MSLENPNVIDHLQTHNEIVSKTESLQFLKLLESEKDKKKQSELMQNNKHLMKGMKDLLQKHVDYALSHPNVLSDGEAKVLIAYDALKDWYLLREIPNNEIERNICAQRIVENFQNIKNFDAHETNPNERYFDIVSGKYSANQTEKTIDLSLSDEHIDITTGDNSLDTYISSSPSLKAYMMQQAKKSRMNQISQATWEYDNKDKNSARSLLHQQVNAKREGMRRDWNTNSEKFQEEFFMNPLKMMEFSRLLQWSNEIWNPSNENSFLLKEIFFSAIEGSFDTHKAAGSLYERGRDLSWDDGISRDGEWNFIKTPAKLRSNNVQIIRNWESIVAKNNITWIDLPITKDVFEKSIKNNQESQKNYDIVSKFEHEFSEKFKKEYILQHNLTQEQFENLSQEESEKVRTEYHLAYMKELFTDPSKRNVYDALLDQEFRKQHGPDHIWEFQWTILNKLTATLPWWPVQSFDASKRNTTMEVVENWWEKVFLIKQWKSSLKLWFNKISDINIDTRTQAQKEEEDIVMQNSLTNQENLYISFEDQLSTYEPNYRQPDLRRAVNKIENPDARDGKQYIDCSNLQLTAKDVAFLSRKLKEQLVNIPWEIQLNLSNNNLENLPKWLFENKKISWINVSNNAIDCLPKLDNWDHIHLKSLDLARNNITSCPNFIEKWIPETLESLDISGNECSDIWPITKLKKLQHLDVDHVWMNSFPEWFGNLEQLQSFSASNNNLSWPLVRDFSAQPWFQSLQSLYLWWNKLEWVDVSQCPNLKKLSVSWNEWLENFPTLAKNEQWKNESMESIYCEHTNIKSVPAWITTHTFPNLKDVDIFDRIVSGENAKNRFLDGSLTSYGYAFHPSVQETKNFFDTPNLQCKYSVVESTDKVSALKKARHELWLSDTDNSPYAFREKNGRVSVYIFAKADQGKDFL